MKILCLEYPRCSTCRKAIKWLDENNIEYTDRHIVENNPTKEELKEWIAKSGLPIRKFFNTSGKLYREMNLSAKLKEMSEDEMLTLLSSDGMIVKRPLVITDDKVLVGFNEEEWKELKN